MSAKIKQGLLLVFCCLFSSAVIAAVEPKNVVVFFLPIQNYDEITSVQEAVPTVLPKGDPKEMNVRDISEKKPYQEKHGISTTVGVSLYDKGEVPLKQATENIVAPARVLILPEEYPASRKKIQKSKLKNARKRAVVSNSCFPDA